MTTHEAFYTPVGIDSITLRRQGNDAVVEVQVCGRYYEVIREHVEGCFSHNVSCGGIRSRIAEAPEVKPTPSSADMELLADDGSQRTPA